MKKKKTILIVVIILIVLLVLGGTFAYLYFGTDLFKSNKELFAKYVVQMGSEEAPFVPTSIGQYSAKKATTPYENNGNFLVNMELLNSASNEETQMLQNLFSFGNTASITFNGKVDNTNQLVEENIALNYTDSINLPIIYKQDGERYGLQSESILPGYWVAVENNNIPNLLLNLGLVTDVSNIPSRIEPQELPSLTFTDEEKLHLITNYITPLFESLGEEKFSKVENTDGSVSYQLTLTNQEVLNLLVQALQTLSQDTMMLEKINNILQEIGGTASSTITAEDIQNTANQLSSSELEAGNVVLSIVQKDRMTTGIGITATDASFEITKSASDSDILYTVTANVGGVNTVTVDMSYTGINSDSVTENYTVSIEEQNVANINYSFTNTVTFGSQITISPFDNNTLILLNNYPAEQLQPFLERLGTTIAEVNTNQMIQIGYPTDMVNPILMWFMAPMLSVSISGTTGTTIDSNIDIQAMQANNASFEAYKGETRGSNVRTLCELVKNYNLQNTTRRINVNLGITASATTFLANVNDIDAIINSIDTSDTYQVSLSYDTATGYICEIGIVSTTNPIVDNSLTDINVNPEDYNENSTTQGDYNLNDILSTDVNDTIVSVENVNGNFVETVD